MRIKRIKKSGIEPVYNMTVAEHHNYMIHGGIILKNCDAMRYFAASRSLAADLPTQDPIVDALLDRSIASYEDAMCGGDVDDGYLTYGGG